MPTIALEVTRNGAAHDLPSKIPWQRQWLLCERNRIEERKRRVRNEWRNLILNGRKLLSATMTNGAWRLPFGYVGVMML
jgi:hypothetical protein